jgi:hypothetical protein
MSQSSQAKIVANWRNSQKSTGPRTPQGKSAVSQNALKHGLSTDRTVIKSENQAEFDLHQNQLLEELAPQTPIESFLAERIASVSWRLRRAENFQNRTIDALANQKTSPIAKLQQALLAKYAPDMQTGPEDSDPELALGRMLIKDFSNSRVLEKLLMYERRIENSFYKALFEIQRLNMIKKFNAEKGNTA